MTQSKRETMQKKLIDELVSASPNRRSFLKTIAAASAGVTALSMVGLTPAEAQTSTEIEVLKFALNLEYLESEFYTYAVNGRGIETFGIGIDGLANGENPTKGGTTTGGSRVGFNNAFQFDTFQTLADIANDERNHVVLLRSALGSQAIARPNINLRALGFGFDNQYDAVKLARIFEDIGVSAYTGAAGLLSTPSVITTAARIVAAEGEHAAGLRFQIALLNIATTAIDGADLIPPPTGSSAQLFSLDHSNGLCATRTYGEVLYLAFGNKANATSGGFFPSGVNGSLTESSTAATATNLAA
jgi:Ferritin-like domain